MPTYYLIERRVMNVQTSTLIEDWGVWKESVTDSEKVAMNQPRTVEITSRVTAFIAVGGGPSVTSEQVAL